ncbi:DUF1801 domain-containing protein [Flavobacterium sp. N1994]|uniref:DUF1801 domain-containing protein n=1 Tax=Flavobacterium sp. N1994 TaxID=2986827 RepID=UPI002222E5F7|nr:DUF1801 domain-containing protein [Flavobacterium sp. N1994]
MAKNKTIATEVDVLAFIDSYVGEEQKKADSYQLIALMRDWTGFEPKMWGPSIIGFGSYHYHYASGHEGDMPLLAFSPRKAAFSLYVYSPTEASKPLLEDLGKFKMGKSCIYVKKLSDIHIPVLEKMGKATIAYLNENKECGCREL